MHRLRALLKGLRQHWAAGLYAVLSMGVIWWIGRDATTTRLITFSQGADFWEHSAALRALLESPWSPGNPHLAIDTPSPRYTPIFWLVAAMGHLLSADVLDLTAFVSCLHVGMFLAGAYWFFASYFEDERAALLGFFVLLMGWWEGWHYSNVYQLQMLPSVASYPSTCALGLSFMAFAWVARLLRRGASRWDLALVTLLAALVLLVHPLTAAMAYTGVIAMVVTEPSASRRLRWQLLGAGALGALLCHFWPFYSPFHVLVGGKGQTSDWIDKAAELTTRRRLHEFYGFRDLVRAFGVALPGVYFLTRMAHLRRHLFAPIGFVVTFGVFVANGFVPIPLGHRFVLLALVFVHIGMVWGCLQVLPGKAMAPGSAWSRWAARVLLGGLLVLGVRHNVEAAETRKRRVAGSAKSSYVLRYARQVGKHAGKDAVILGSRRALWSVPTFGPKVVSAYHSNPLVADEKQRRRDVSRFFSRKSSTQQRRDILERYHVTHLLIQPKSAAKLREIIAGRRPERIAAGYRLYDLRSEPASERGKPSKGLE